MRIRNSITPPSVSHFPSPSPSPPSPSSSSSSSSIHSTISAHSLTSSSDSTSSFISTPRCNGLDLLVKAIYHVSGSVIGVPYIQRRVIRRRKRAVKFNTFIIDSIKENDGVVNEVENGEVLNKQSRRSSALPFKYKDSVLQDWKNDNRRRKRSNRA